MTRDSDIPDLNLKCVLNGRRLKLPCPVAWQLMYRCQYSWLVPLDYFTWHVNGWSGSTYIYDKMTPAPRRFLWLVYSRGTRATTPQCLEALEGEGTIITTNVLQSRAAKACCSLFGEQPEEVRPFLYHEDIDDMRRRWPAYRMRPDRNAIMILGLADNSDQRSDLGAARGQKVPDIDWHLMLEPPPRADEQIEAQIRVLLQD